MSLRPVEWEILHPLDTRPLAIVRLLELGDAREAYYRAVTCERDPARRRLLGYWGSLEHARLGVLALYERSSGHPIGGVASPAGLLPLIPWKPAPTSGPRGMATRPATHGKAVARRRVA